MNALAALKKACLDPFQVNNCWKRTYQLYNEDFIQKYGIENAEKSLFVKEAPCTFEVAKNLNCSNKEARMALNKLEKQNIVYSYRTSKSSYKRWFPVGFWPEILKIMEE